MNSFFDIHSESPAAPFTEFARLVPDLLVLTSPPELRNFTLIYANPAIGAGSEEEVKLLVGDIKDRLLANPVFADRYGGVAISTNGGSGRAIFDGEYYIKGVGPSPLVGNSIDSRHVDGRLSLVEACAEIFWTYLIEKSFPHGASRCLAAYAVDEGSALLIREPTIRLAHFERASYFRPKEHCLDQWAADVRRTQVACQIIWRFLPQPGPITDAGLRISKATLVEEGLAELCRRHAAQLAHSRSTFLLHSYSSSNISIDGKLTDGILIDLNPAATKIDNEFKFAWYRLWNFEFGFFQSLANVIFFLRKYSEQFTSLRQDLYGYCIQSFRDEYRKSIAEELLLLFGVPRSIAASLKSSQVVVEWALRVCKLVQCMVNDAVDNTYLPVGAVARLSLFRSAIVEATFGRIDLDESSLRLYRLVDQEVRTAASNLGISILQLRRAMYFGTFARTVPTTTFSFSALQRTLSAISENFNDSQNAFASWDQAMEELFDLCCSKIANYADDEFEIALSVSEGEVLFYNWYKHIVRFKSCPEFRCNPESALQSAFIKYPAGLSRLEEIFSGLSHLNREFAG